MNGDISSKLEVENFRDTVNKETGLQSGTHCNVVGWGTMLQAESRGFKSRLGRWFFQLT
jgi:hypothetical protein